MGQRHLLDYLNENKNKPGFDRAPYVARIAALNNEACAILLNNLAEGQEAIAEVFYSWFSWDQVIYIHHTWSSYKNSPLVVEFALRGAEDSHVNHGEVDERLIDEYITPLTPVHPPLLVPKYQPAPLSIFP